MECPRRHELYELERGTASREDAERLRRHLAECDQCRKQADALRDMAAMLEGLSDRMRTDLSDQAVESLYRRARVHGLLGRPIKRSLGARAQRSRWLRLGVPVAAAIAAAVLIAVGLHLAQPERVVPAGALDRLVAGAAEARGSGDLLSLAPLARAAVGEQLAQREPRPDQVADLALVAYITRRPRESRQVRDVRFLLESVARRARKDEPVARVRPPWPMLASVVLADAGSPGGGPVSPAEAASAARADDPSVLDGCLTALAEAKSCLLAGDYKGALAALPPDEPAWALEAWCLHALGGSAAAARVLAEAQAQSDDPTIRVLRADLALQDQDVAEAMRQYETLAEQRERYWFAAGYLYRYELADPRGAGLRFRRLRDPRLAGYVNRSFRPELDAAVQGPRPVAAEDFDSYGAGAPADWALVRARGGEFQIVDVPGGKALQQDEVDFQGAELLLGKTGWVDYTLQVDMKVTESHGDYALGAAVYRRADHTGYVLELSRHRLRLLKQFAAAGRKVRFPGTPPERILLEPTRAQMRLEEPPAEGWWYTLKVRVHRVADGVSVAGKFWRSDTEEPLGWQLVWTDAGQAGVPPLGGGLAGVQISGAKVLVDNLIVTRNERPQEMGRGAAGR